MPTLASLPLRPRKQAVTRLALLEAALDQLERAGGLEAVAVRDLCAAAGISEASFFNYFPQKSDLLVHFVQLWSLDLAWQVHALAPSTTAREAIETIFVATAHDAKRRPRVMAEVLAHQARMTEAPRQGELTLADRLAAFPDRPGIEELPSLGLDGLLPPLIERAIARGELPATLDRQAAFVGLAALFLGVPTILLRIDPALVEPVYRQQLAIYWAGLGATAGARASTTPTPSARRRPARSHPSRRRAR